MAQLNVTEVYSGHYGGPSAIVTEIVGEIIAVGSGGRKRGLVVQTWLSHLADDLSFAVEV